MKAFHITANDAGQRVDKFLTKAAPALPHPLLYKAIRKKRYQTEPQAVRDLHPPL